MSPLPEEVKRMNINVQASLHDAFKAATAARGQKMTDVLLEFIEQYVQKYGTSSPKRAKR